MPTLSHENEKKHQFKYIIGVDEVGRGPWAGPVVACACIIPDEIDLPEEINDSKKLSPKKREKIYAELSNKISFEIAEVTAEVIDSVNILQATFLAMETAVVNLCKKLDIKEDEFFVLVDGNKTPNSEAFKNSESIIKGDSISLSIACSSILAKVYRDKLMAEYAVKYPYYGWENNAGYGTKLHQEGIAQNGITELHRKSFKPIAKLIQE